MMVHHVIAPDPEQRTAEIHKWRWKCLRQAGIPEPLAHDAAADGRFDLHRLLELLDNGCPAELAVRIISPLPGHPDLS